MENITITLPKDDVILIVKSMKIAQAKKQCEIRQHLRKNQEEHTKNKLCFIHQSNQLTQYIEYLIK